MATSTRVIVAATEPLLLAGCRAVLGAAPDISIVSECSTMRSMIRAMRVHRPHVLVIDGALCEPFEGCARLPPASPQTNIAWLARPGVRAPDQDDFPELLAVLPPEVASVALVECVRALAAGRPWRMPPQAGKIGSPAALAAGDGRSPLAALTFRERQIVLGVTSGKRNREIAESLGITPGTVKLHLHKAFGKLGVHSRLALFKKLVQEAQPRRTQSA